MNRPFAIYPGALDIGELGYWQFGERAGRLTPVGAGPDFVNHGAVAEQDGRRFVKADGDHMNAAFPGQPERSQMTLECWVRDYGLALGQVGQIASYGVDENVELSISAGRNANPLLSHIAVGCIHLGYAQWQSTDVDALLAGSVPWHVAGVLDAPNTLRLFVNGIQQGENAGGIAALPADDYILTLGRHITGWDGYDLSAVIDEVRLSKTVRYAGGANGTRYFWPVRFGEGRRAIIRGPGDGVCLGGIAV